MKAHTLHRLLSSIYGKPALISKEAFQVVSSYLHSRNAGLMSFPQEDKKDEKKELYSVGGVGMLSIRGPLTYRSSGWEAFCGGYSYEMLLDEAAELIESGCTSIVMDCDSGGGEAYGCFEAANDLRAMCDEAGVKLYGYVDGSACSAMYALLCVCDEVVANQYADVGSIGVLIALHNDSKMLEKEGIERIFITDGTEKVPFEDDGSFREGFLDDLRARVAQLGDAFRSHVSMHTGLSTEELKATNAKVFSAQEALSLGLINKIQTRSEFVSYVVSQH